MQTNVSGQRLSHHVYVIELSKRVWTDNWKFRKANPHYMGGTSCLYVGMTSLSPKMRFEKHKSKATSKKGFKISSSIVERYGLYLRPSMYHHLNPLTSHQAKYVEEQLAISLRKNGYAVWWN